MSGSGSSSRVHTAEQQAKVAGEGLPTELRAQDQAPSNCLPPSGVGWHGELPMLPGAGNLLPVWSMQDLPQL